MALALEGDDSVNQELMIYGLRNNMFTNLIVSGETIAFGELGDWASDPAGLTITSYRLESLAWGCLSEIETTYEYISNYFRPVVINPNLDYVFQNSLACRLYEAEPFFSIPPAEAIEIVEDILAQSSRDEPDSQAALQRAEMVLAVLYALEGQPAAALDLVTMLQSEAAPGSWLESQVTIFISMMGQSSITALDLCAALTTPDGTGACDVNQVLERALTDFPLNRDDPIPDQLALRGLAVLETRTISQIGRADRLAVLLDLPGVGWWAFAPLEQDDYVAERIDPPVSDAPDATPIIFLDAPQGAVDALLSTDDTRAVLARIDTVIQNNPGVPLSPQARYLQALAYDLAANRTRARDGYFSLWEDYPQTLWGQLAAAHLERR